jgi:hypothetical protein
MTTDANGLQVATNNVKVNTGTYSTLTGSTITTSSIVTPAIVGTVTLGQNASSPNRYVELGTDLANSMYLDFHSHDTQLPDYSTRIQSFGGATTGSGVMNLYGSTIGIMGTAGVGIGKTNPSYALDVAGTVNISGSYYVNGAPMSSSQWTTSGSIIYYNGGNVGIGIASPGNLVDIQGATRSGTHATGRPLYITGDIADASAGVEIRHTNGTQGVGIGYNSLYACGSTANQPINLMPKGTSGVGIGTFSPAYGLDIYSNNISLTASSYMTPHMRLQSQYSACYLSVGAVLGVNSYIGLQSGVATSSALGTPPFVVTNANTVGVNTTNPSYAFDVTGYARATSGLLAGNGTGAVSLQLFDLPAASWQITTGGYNLSINNNSSSWTNRVTILQNGYVGIGTISPSWKCHIYGTGGSDAGILVRSITAGDNYSMLGLGNDYYSAAGYLFFNSSTRTGDGGANCLTLRNDVGDLRLQAKGANGIIVKNTSCYVGINTASPSCTFEVNGIANIKGTTSFAVPNNYMSSGSLTIGDTTQNYGGSTNWSSNTAAILLECLNATEIAIHDAGERVVSHSYYSGNRIYMGRDMGWGVTPVSFRGRVSIGGEGDTTANLCVTNPNGSITHFGYSNNWNYLRGAYTQIDCNTNVAGTLAASGGVYTSDWFRVNGTGGVHWENYGRGIQSVDGVGAIYGCVSTYGAGINSWGGYDIYGRYTFMANGNTVGIHDRNNSWAFYAVNSQVTIPHSLTVQGKCILQNGGGWDSVPLEITASATFGTGYVGDLGIYMFMHSGNGDQWAIGGNRQWNSNMYFLGNTYTWNALEVCGYIEQDSAGTYRMNFTGQHRSAYDDTINNTTCEGLIVQSTGEYWSLLQDFDNTSMIDHITIDESLPMITLTNTIESPAVFGVISYTEDPEHTRQHSMGRFVSVYQNPDGERNRVFVNSLGEGAVWVCNYNGSFANGDYITTCSVPGYGMKQSTNHLMNYTLGKITTNCDFHPPQRPVRQIKKKPGTVTRPILVDKVTEEYKESTEWNEAKQKYIKKKILVDTKTIKVQAEEEVDIYDENDVLIGKEVIKKTETVTDMVNDLDSAGHIQWIDAVDDQGVAITKPAYQTRYLRPDGTIITKTEYDQAHVNGDTVYIAAFVGCTYHSG